MNVLGFLAKPEIGTGVGLNKVTHIFAQNHVQPKGRLYVHPQVRWARRRCLPVTRRDTRHPAELNTFASVTGQMLITNASTFRRTMVTLHDPVGRMKR